MEQLVREMLNRTYPLIRQAGNGWVLETAPNIFVPVPDPGNMLAYIAHQGRWTPAQLCDIQFALQKRIPLPPDPSTIFYLEQCLAAAS